MNILVTVIGYLALGSFFAIGLVVVAVEVSDRFARHGWELNRDVDLTVTPHRLLSVSVDTRERLETIADFLNDDLDHDDLSTSLYALIQEWDNSEETQHLVRSAA